MVESGEEVVGGGVRTMGLSSSWVTKGRGEGRGRIRMEGESDNGIGESNQSLGCRLDLEREEVEYG